MKKNNEYFLIVPGVSYILLVNKVTFITRTINCTHV